MPIQELGWQAGPRDISDNIDFTPLGLQESCEHAHRQSASASSLPPPYSFSLPSYASSVDGSQLGWWEDGAENTLRGHDLQAIQLVCRFRTYRDESLPGEILRSRWPPLLSSFFVSLRAGDQEIVIGLDVDQKVKGILKQLSPSFPSPEPLEIHLLHDLLCETDALLATLELNKISCSAFKRITFSDWARAARDPDDYVEPVGDFFDWHGSLQNIVENRLQNFPDEIAKYIEMEKLLPEQSPARWAVSQSLRSNRPNGDAVAQPGHESILCELQGFFKRQHRNPVAALRQLAILEIRFQRMYLDEEEIDWTHRFWTNVDFFERITTTLTTEIADSLTELDLTKLRLIPPQQFINGEGRCLQYVHRRCNRLCEAVQESIIFANQLNPLIASLAKELHTRRNFHSLIPTLQALRETGFDESTLSDLFPLINSDRNYSCYRKAYEEAPSVPFLPPHIRQLRHCQEKGLSQIYASLTYKNPKNLIRAQISGKEEDSCDQKQLSWCSWTWAKLLSCLLISDSTET